MIAGNEGCLVVTGLAKSGVDVNSAALEVLVRLISFSSKRIT